MKRFALSFLAGVVIAVGSALFLWFTLPYIFSAATGGSDTWLGWFPFATFVPALLLGGYCSARLVLVRRVPLGFFVGLFATAFAGLLFRSSGQTWFSLFILFIGGALGAIGAHLTGKHASSP